MSHDLVLAGGRVVDPETGFDRVCDVGIDGDSVTVVGDRLDGATIVDVGGLVVAPGFVDLHSHAQTLPGRRLQACDGVTTALDLERRPSPSIGDVSMSVRDAACRLAIHCEGRGLIQCGRGVPG